MDRGADRRAADKSLLINSAPGWTRTSDKRIRSPLLYPTELQAPEPAGRPDHGPRKGAGDGIRTRDKRLGRPMLCQLSYTRLSWPAAQPVLRLVSEHLWSGREDLNHRPPAPKAGALPGCATSRQPRFPASAARVYPKGPRAGLEMRFCPPGADARVQAGRLPVNWLRCRDGRPFFTPHPRTTGAMNRDTLAAATR
jgi:hypothetical protein